MALNDKAIFTAATGFIFKAPVGTAAPSREQVRDFDPDTFGAGSTKLTKTGKATGGTFKVTVGGQQTEDIAHDADAATVQAAVEKLSNVGAGNVVVTSVADGFRVSFIGKLFGQSPEVSVEANLTGGSSNITAGGKVDALGWEPIGHTSEEELPEFGFEGGETETKGTWQKKAMKEVVTETPVDYVTYKAHQFDTATLEMYYGKNVSKVDGVFGVDNPASQGIESAILIVIVDGDYRIGFTAAKASTRRDEAIALASDGFAVLPLRSTFIKHPGRNLFNWITPAAAA